MISSYESYALGDTSRSIDDKIDCLPSNGSTGLTRYGTYDWYFPYASPFSSEFTCHLWAKCLDEFFECVSDFLLRYVSGYRNDESYGFIGEFFCLECRLERSITSTVPVGEDGSYVGNRCDLSIEFFFPIFDLLFEIFSQEICC